MYFPVGPITAILFATSSCNTNPYPSDTRFTMGYDLSKEADELLDGGQYQRAIPAYEEAIAMGRKPALALIEQQQAKNDETETDSETASSSGGAVLDWIILLYRNLAYARLQSKDIAGARGAAWAACVYSQNADLASLDLFANVCKAGGDMIGRVQTIKQILELAPPDEKGLSQDENEKRTEMGALLVELEQQLADQFAS